MLCNLLLLSTVLRIALGCSTEKDLTRLILNSQKTGSGQWVAKVSMEHDEDPGPLEMKLDHKIIKCAERNRVLMVATITGPAPETDYELIPGHGLYKIHNGKMNWYKALKTCKREDAHLVILNSEEELTKLKFLGKIEGDFYTSINDLEKEGHFVTQFGDTLNSTGFMKWIPGEPNNGFSGNCVRVLPTLGKIADGDCNANFAFICEKPIS